MSCENLLDKSKKFSGKTRNSSVKEFSNRTWTPPHVQLGLVHGKESCTLLQISCFSNLLFEYKWVFATTVRRCHSCFHAIKCTLFRRASGSEALHKLPFSEIFTGIRFSKKFGDRRIGAFLTLSKSRLWSLVLITTKSQESIPVGAYRSLF